MIRVMVLQVAITEGIVIGDVGWSYAEPYGPVVAIVGHIAFYPERVEIIEHPAAREEDIH